MDRLSGCVVVVVALIAAGCVSGHRGGEPVDRANRKPRVLSSGFIGCQPDEIEISDIQSEGSTASWVATCKGKRFVCAEDGGGVFGPRDVFACTPELS